jgi:hypothetical protein
MVSNARRTCHQGQDVGQFKTLRKRFQPPLNIKYIFDRFPRRARVFQFYNANLVKIIELTKLSVLRFVKRLCFSIAVQQDVYQYSRQSMNKNCIAK